MLLPFRPALSEEVLLLLPESPPYRYRSKTRRSWRPQRVCSLTSNRRARCCLNRSAPWNAQNRHVASHVL